MLTPCGCSDNRKAFFVMPSDTTQPIMPTSQPIVPVSQSQAPYYLGVDVGGTNIKIGLVDDHGHTLAFEEIETHEPDGPQQAVERIAQCGRRLVTQTGIATGDLVRVGLGVPGTMDIPNGMFVEPPNLPHWFHFPMRDAVSQACGLPVSFI
ncbi:MAG: ROK family protein, partial [Pirellulaceae bacterium]|nr:ROK family protein [Pirellulaceae bacterium]